MVGLGVMGRNLVLNMAERGFAIAGYDLDPSKIAALRKEAQEMDVHGANDIPAFIALLREPRMIMILVPAGAPVDAVIAEVLPHLATGDLIIDAGNSYFKDTSLRAGTLATRGIAFLGVGISGGEEGARHGPSIMPGGPRDAYERVRPLFEAAAAQVDGQPCVTWLGPGSAGHFVKMVHNGIEYAVMQLIAETYDLMKRGLGMDDDAMHGVYASWNTGPLAGYLMEITSRIFMKQDATTGLRLIDEILDIAKQKGTGLWTSQCAMELQVPIPTIDLAVSMRDMSILDVQRQQAGSLYQHSIRRLTGDHDAVITELGSALVAAMMITYAQGMALLSVASSRHGSNLDLAEVARIWRGGCIIRSAMLDDIGTAFRARPGLPNLLLDPAISRTILVHQESLRQVVSLAATSGTPIPALMVSLAYFDAYCSSWLPANLIQAQRDFFGAHTYERNDCKGTFHTSWESR
jgi:6-phosphogluconate dehydrogenase